MSNAGGDVDVVQRGRPAESVEELEDHFIGLDRWVANREPGLVRYKYARRDRDGNHAGETEIGYHPKPGDEIRLSGNRKATVTAVLPVELMEEFVDRVDFGVLEVELQPS